jgi:Family of unknown function (DUF6338)
MAPATGTALLILAVFVLPGFVTLLFRERMFAVRGEDTPFERLLNALFYSAVVYAIVIGIGAAAGLDKGDVVAFYKGRKSLGDDLAAAAILAIGAPLVIAFGGLRWRDSKAVRPWVLLRLHISPSHGVSSGWNEAFEREAGPMLRVTLRDRRVVGGYFGARGLAGYSEHAQDLYIDERWTINPENDWFGERAAGTEGLWIARDEIVSIEFYDSPAQPDEESPASDQHSDDNAADQAE